MVRKKGGKKPTFYHDRLNVFLYQTSQKEKEERKKERDPEREKTGSKKAINIYIY